VKHDSERVREAAIAHRYLAQGEEVVLALRKHPTILLGPLLLAVGAMLAAAFLGFVTSPGDGADLIDTLFGLLALAAVARFAWKFTQWYVDRIYITSQRVFEVSGVFTRKVASMPLRRVTDMTYSRSILARLLGYGTLELESAGQQQGLTELDHLPRPDDIYRTLTSLMSVTLGDPEQQRTVFHGVRVDDEDTGPLPRISL
jgi:membrane protein YdbS with pleckstrin-like domain